MKRVSSIVAVSLALTLAYATHASASDVEEGEQLYLSQCKACHGFVNWKERGLREPFYSPRRIQLAMLDSVTTNAEDLVSQLTPAFGTKETQSMSRATGELLAVALPHGPNLRGVVGRSAATVEGYVYSKPILKTLKGMVWSEEKIDRWITDTQAWVPGGYMYYKQNDPEIRRKIILYLKANP